MDGQIGSLVTNMTNTRMSDISLRYIPSEDSEIILVSILSGILFLMIMNCYLIQFLLFIKKLMRFF